MNRLYDIYSAIVYTAKLYMRVHSGHQSESW